MTEPIPIGTRVFVDEVLQGGQLVRVLIENPDSTVDVERTYSRDELIRLLGQAVELEGVVEGDRFEFMASDSLDVESFGIRPARGDTVAQKVDDTEMRRQIRRLVSEVLLLPSSRHEGNPP